ncbi:MAG: DUF2703 domain-containing protein [Eubacteriaceae bacterium]|nr:DUF2703 domain-containing protein [Eubacteriaceae bacterium]
MAECSCGCSNDCCKPAYENKKIKIDFLYLDLDVCERCQSTDDSLGQAIGDVSAVLKAAGYDITVNKIHIATKELAMKYEFISSPTIRINGKDIALELKESNCKDCGDLCGDSVDCRVWVYEGSEYTSPPKEMIINAILREVYNPGSYGKKEEYKMPENLEIFFKARQ